MKSNIATTTVSFIDDLAGLLLAVVERLVQKGLTAFMSMIEANSLASTTNCDSMENPMTPEWMLVNLTLVSVTLTAIYVVATIFIVVSNKRTADATRKQVKELQWQFQETNRPHVCVRVEDVRDGLLCLSIENTGNTPARDLRISINEEFLDAVKDGVMKDPLPKLIKSSIYLSPKQKLYCCVGGPVDFSRLKEQMLLVDAMYKGDGDREYSENIEIDIDAYGWALCYESPLGDIASHIKKISENLEKVERKLN